MSEVTLLNLWQWLQIGSITELPVDLNFWNLIRPPLVTWQKRTTRVL